MCWIVYKKWGWELRGNRLKLGGRGIKWLVLYLRNGHMDFGYSQCNYEISQNELN